MLYMTPSDLIGLTRRAKLTKVKGNRRWKQIKPTFAFMSDDATRDIQNIMLECIPCLGS